MVASIWCADNQRTWVHATGPVSGFGDFIDNLIEGRIHVIGKLYFSDGFDTIDRKAESKASDSLFTDGCIEATVGTESFLKTFRGTENTAISTGIFTESHHIRVPLKGQMQSVIDRFYNIHYRHISVFLPF